MIQVFNFGRNLKHCDKPYIPMEYENMRGNEFYGVWKETRPLQFISLYSFFKYMTLPKTTQVLVLPARSEQYGLFLTPND